MNINVSVELQANFNLGKYRLLSNYGFRWCAKASLAFNFRVGVRSFRGGGGGIYRPKNRLLRSNNAENIAVKDFLDQKIATREVCL